MKIIRGVPLGRLQETIAKLDKPELWAMQSFNWDYNLQRWNCRKVMARSIRMQQRREHRNGDWKPVVALTDGEGY